MAAVIRAAQAPPPSARPERSERPGWRPTERLFGVLCLAGLAYLLAAQSQTGWLYLVVALLGGSIPIGMLYPWLAVKRLQALAMAISPELPPHEGVTLVLRLTLLNPGWLPRYWLEVTDTSGLMATEGRPGRRFVHHIPAKGRVVLQWPVRCARRGVFDVPSLHVSTAAPFGLARAAAPIWATPTEVVVYPRWWPLPSGSPPEMAGNGMRGAQRQGGGELYGTRPYRSGDNLRWVHWRSTARHGALIVREFEKPATAALSIVLDAGPGAAFEVAVRLAASAVRWAADNGYTAYLHSNSAIPEAPRGALSGMHAHDYLARVRQSGDATPLPGVVASLGYTSLALIVASRPLAELVAPLVALRRHGGAVTVAVASSSGDATGPFVAALEEAGVGVVSFGPESHTVEVSLC